MDCERAVVEDEEHDEESTTEVGEDWGNDNGGPVVVGGLELTAAVGLLLPVEALAVAGICAKDTVPPICQVLGVTLDRLVINAMSRLALANYFSSKNQTSSKFSLLMRHVIKMCVIRVRVTNMDNLDHLIARRRNLYLLD